MKKFIKSTDEIPSNFKLIQTNGSKTCDCGESPMYVSIADYNDIVIVCDACNFQYE